MYANVASSVSIIILLTILMVATWTDITRHRIPNLLSLGGMVLGLVLQVWGIGIAGLVNGLGGVSLGLLLFLPFYVVGGMAAGDVKLMAAVGAFLGTSHIMSAIAMTLIFGGVLGVLVLLSRRGMPAAWGRYALILKCLWTTGKFYWIPPAPGEAAATPFPYALAILFGTVSTLWGLGHFNQLLSL